MSAACPGSFAGKACDPNGFGNAVCTIAGGNITCDLAQEGDVYDTVSFYVNPSTGTFRAYGQEAAYHNDFCCEMNTGTNCAGPGSLNVLASGHQDSISLTDSVNAWSMLDCTTSSVYGDDGNDSITGSTQAGVYDYLFGEDNDDVIHGLDGADYLDGGLGADVCFGDAGDDTIYGGDGSGADLLNGGPGSDTMYGYGPMAAGSDGDDRMKGGDDGDYMYGGDGADWLCGENGADWVYGGNSDNDIVFGGAGADNVNDGGPGGGDDCENDAWTIDCDTHGRTTCPW